MWRTRRSIDIALAFAAVQIVFCVSGFAQSNNDATIVFAIDRTAFGAMREYVADAPAAPWMLDLPRNLIVPSTHHRVVQSMLERSPTFRRQCVRLAHSRDVIVTLRIDSPRPYLARARTRIARRVGRVEATIEVFQLEDQIELIAHEIEHVIEQLDGIDLASKVDTATSGVRMMGQDMMFETARAIRVGRTVAEEVRRAGG